MKSSEPVTLHFDLSHCPQDAEFTLLGGGGLKHKLTAYADAPERLDEHRRTNKALALIGDEHIQRITHFVEDAEIAADHATVRRVVYPSQDDHSLPEIAVAFVHVPTADQERFVQARPASAGHKPHLEMLAHYGVEPHAVADEDHDDVRLHADRIKPPRETAKTLVFHHYEIGSTNPAVAKDVLDHYITQADGFQDLQDYIATNGPESDNTWYQKNYATWVNPDTGKTEPVPANMELADKYKDGRNPDWPVVDGTPQIPQYELTDDTTSKDGGVVGAAGKVVRSVLVTTKNQDQFNGQLYTTQVGTTTRVQTNVAPHPEAPRRHPNVVAAAAPRLTAGDVPAAKGFAVKNATSTYGLWLYDDEMTFKNGTLSFPIKNWPSRYLSMYVQFLKATGEPIRRADIPGWTDPMPEFLRGAFEPSDTKNYLDLVSSGNAVFGIPIPPLTQKTDVTFPWPNDASSAHVLLGGLGAAQGFTDWDPDVDIGGVIATGLFCYGVTALSMAFTVYVVNPFLASLKGDAKIAFYIVGGLVGATEAAVGGPMYGSKTGKMILTKLAGQVAGVIFGIVVNKIVMAAAKDAMEEIIAASVAEITAEEALGEIPVAGWALKIASVAADIAGLAATTIESLASPATYSLEIQRTMDLTVTVSPDPAHGTDTQKANWPLVADHWIVQVKYPKSQKGQGGTTYTKSGPMPGPPHNQPLVIPFPHIPAGGKIEIVAGVYSENDWLAGQWNSGWINAVPDANDELAAAGNIEEKLVPLTGDTTYSQKQRVVYDDTHKHHWQVTRFAIADSPALVVSLDAATAGKDLRTAFAAQGSDLSSNVSVAVKTQGQAWQVTDTGAGVSYQLDRRMVVSGNGGQQYEIEVQNLTHAAPARPDVIHDCGQDGHRLCELQNITYNDKEYMLGYSWRASGQNLPRDTGSAPDNGQLYAFQAMTALGQPEDRIVQPTRGFSNPSFLAFDQFGLAPLMTLDDAKKAGTVDRYRTELDSGGAVPSDLAGELAAFGVKVPGDAQVTVVAADQRWTIGSPSADPVLDIRIEKEVVSNGAGPQLQNVINVYAWPVPSQDNFYLDSRSYSDDNKQYFLRGVSFGTGETTFDYDTTKSWGRFQDVTINDLAVHPHGYVVGVDYDNHKLLTLKLGAEPIDDDKSPIAMPLSGEGVREGLLNKPVALTVTADGRILVLEELNQRVQAFDVLGNPVPCFSVGQQPFQIDGSLIATLDSRDATTALVQAFQRNVTPAVASVFAEEDDPAPASVTALDGGTVDQALSDAFAGAGVAKTGAAFTVDVTTAGSLWLVTDTGSQAVYDVRYASDEFGEQHLYVFRAFALGIEVKSAGSEWLVTDTQNAMTFDVVDKDTTQDKSSPDVQVRRLVPMMPLRTQDQTGVTHIDIAAEATGYIYTLLTRDQDDGTKEYFLEVYAPDGTPLFAQPGVYVAKIAVDQWRSLFSLNYETLLGPGQRTEPGVSQWQPSTPAGVGPS